MRLLVSVRGPVEARAALAGGADVIDAKDPARGALGAVSAERLAAIRRTVGAVRPVSPAPGGAREEGTGAGAAGRAAGGASVWRLPSSGVRRARRRGGRRMRRGPERPRVSGAGRGPTAPGPRGAPPHAPARGPRVTPRRAGPDRPPSPRGAPRQTGARGGNASRRASCVLRPRA